MSDSGRSWPMLTKRRSDLHERARQGRGLHPGRGQPSGEGRRHRDEVEVGVEQTAEALEHHERGEEHRQLARDREVVVADEGHDLVDEVAHSNLVQRLVVVLRDEVADLALEFGDVDLARAAGGGEQGVDGERDVVVDDRHEQVRQLVSTDLRDGAAPAEVREADAAVGQREEVSRVRIAVVEAVHEDLLEVAVDAPAGQLGPVHRRLRSALRAC